MVNHHPLIVVLVAFAAGIVSDRYTGVTPILWWTLAAVGLLSWSVTRRWGPSAWLLLVAVAACGATWHELRWRWFRDDDLGRYAQLAPTPVCVEAIARSHPRWVPAPPADPLSATAQGDQTRLEVRIQRVRSGDAWYGASGLALLVVEGHLPDVASGDRVRIVAELMGPSPALNPGQLSFAEFERAERRLSRLSASYPDCVTLEGGGKRWTPRNLVQQLRWRSSAMLWRYLRHEQSGLADALLLGAREQLDRDRVNAFFYTGTIHLLSISGLHVGILASGFFLLARTSWLSPRAALVATMLLTIIYALLTDARAPVVRATILVCVVCLGWILRRPAFAFNSLAAAALVVLAWNPCELFRTGAQLSFLAAAALAWFALQWSAPTRTPLDKLVERSRPWPRRFAHDVGRKVWGLAAVSALIWIVTLPLVMFRFHLVSPSALVLNVVLSIPVTLALLCGFAVLVSGWLMPPLAWLFAAVCDASLWSLETCVQAAQHVPGSYFWAPGPPGWWVAGFYFMLAVVVAGAGWRAMRNWGVALLIGWVACGAVAAQWRAAQVSRGEPTLQCTFLAVGHGTCVVMELPGGHTLLYDAGSLGASHVPTHVISSFLWFRGIRHLDHVVLSHADLDHYNAMPGLLEQFRVGTVYVSSVMFREFDDSLRELHSAIASSKARVVQLHAGSRIPAGGPARLGVVHPPPGGVAGNDNANSLVMEIQYADKRIVLSGDVEGAGLQALLDGRPIDCDVAMAPHHGSPNSDPAQFAAWCSPEWVIISGGHRHTHDHVAPLFEQAGVKVMNTATQGAIRVVIDRSGVQVAPWSDPLR
jgi:competence protein ComEC